LNRSNEVPSFTPAPASFEPSVPAAPTANPFAAAAAGAGQGGWVTLPNSASRRGLAEEPKSQDAGAASARAGMAGPGQGDIVDPVPHVVRREENFWTISRLYYGSGRFYMALWKANSDQVPAPDQLRVNQTIRIPPPEALDRSLIQPPRAAASAAPPSASSVRRASASGSGSRSGVEQVLPVDDAFANRGSTSTTARRPPGELVAAADDGGGAAARRRAPMYRIRPHETLRSIARDTLGDSRRARELLEMNRDVIDDPDHLTPGQVIDLPEDARPARRAP
jgi:nucleoid-associated protein YgaU